MEDWQRRYGDSIKVHSFKPATREQLYQAHSKDYVDGVLDLRYDNGFGNKSKAVAESLLYTTGSMIAAAKHLLTTEDEVPYAASLTSGFHHAGYEYGGGYCTFNGLMATAIELKRIGLADKIAIFDFDQHYGDGTEDIINRLGIDYVTHITAGKSYRTAVEALRQLSRIPEGPVRQWDIILFQAGADIHVDDPLGGIMTTEEMWDRDGRVFSFAIKRAIPVLFNLAGGYKRDAAGTIEPVLKLHRQTIELALRCGSYGIYSEHPQWD